MPELSKPGGVSYEFVLEEARAQRSEHPHLKCSATPTPSAQDIERKLKVFSSCPWNSIHISNCSVSVSWGEEKVKGSLRPAEICWEGEESGGGESQESQPARHQPWGGGGELTGERNDVFTINCLHLLLHSRNQKIKSRDKNMKNCLDIKWCTSIQYLGAKCNVFVFIQN